MKKINAKTHQKDRIICVSYEEKHVFYYQPYKSNEQLYLFEKDYSPSIYSYFKDYGVCLNGLGYSLTLKQLYEHRSKYRNSKLKSVFERLPGMIAYVIRENAEEREWVKNTDRVKNAIIVNYDDREDAA